MNEVAVKPREIGSFEGLMDPGQWEDHQRTSAALRERLGGAPIWHVNSSSGGGGVAEMLRSLVGLQAGEAIDARWAVVAGDIEFFTLTKRIHNRLHGSIGDGGPLGRAERDHYEHVAGRNLVTQPPSLSGAPVAILHDPQTLGLAPALSAQGSLVVWVCHVGADLPNDRCREAWAFLRPYLEHVAAVVFSRSAFVWEGLDRVPAAAIPPCIDAFSTKNLPLEAHRRDAILGAAGVVPADGAVEPDFVHTDGSTGTISRTAAMIEEAPVAPGTPVVAQVSRWDRLKDPIGVMRGFAQRVPASCGAHLILAGPASGSVADDPEGTDVLADVRDAWLGLAPSARARVHVASIPTYDLDENAAIVNALQRRADVVVQKSLAEGFGLTVTEALWKERPVVASRVGGIRDQIVDGEHGILVDPVDLDSFGDAITELLGDPGRAGAIAHAGRERVRTRFLAPHWLTAMAELLDPLLAGR